MIKEKSCGAVVFNEQMDKVLLIRHLKGHVAFPKGHVEDKETEEETAIREVKEETGIDIEIISKNKHHISYSPKPNYYKDVYFFIGKAIGGELRPQPEEIDECFWCEIDKVLKYITYEKDKKLFSEILKEITD